MRIETVKNCLSVLVCCITLMFLAGSAYSSSPSDSELAKQAQNPVANLISLPLQNNTNFDIGPDDETQNIFNIQPVWPFEISDSFNLITRTILPVVSQPDIFTGGEGRINGLGDTIFTGFLSPRNSKTLIWGAGPVFLLPTATDDALGADKWGAGPSAVLVAMPGRWVIGSLFNNVWSFAGSGDRDVNLFTWQYFVNYNMANGWYLNTAPIITANWEADSDNTWTVPFGAGIGRIFKIGRQPINALAAGYYNAVSPDSGADWQLRLQIQFLFPK